jgi:DNA-binding LacI/PurR family transcriptional regulator
LKEIGKKAAELLIRTLDEEVGQTEEQISQIALPCTMVLRKSVKKLI